MIILNIIEDFQALYSTVLSFFKHYPQQHIKEQEVLKQFAMGVESPTGT